jgi:hypothetical protein
LQAVANLPVKKLNLPDESSQFHRLADLAGDLDNAKVLPVVSALKQDLALFWLVDSAFPEATRFFADSYKSLRFARPHFDQLPNLLTAEAAAFRTNHPCYSLNFFVTPL